MRGACLVLLLLLWPAARAAVDPAPCLSCHDGSQPNAPAPLLEGQHREYLEIQLRRFREHVRQSFPMDALVQGLDDGVIAELASYFSQQPWRARPAAMDGRRIGRGAELGQRHDCIACHGPTLRGGGSIPRLAGQAAPYLALQIGAFADSERYHPPTGEGGRMLQFSSDDAEALAAWLAAYP